MYPEELHELSTQRSRTFGTVPYQQLSLTVWLLIALALILRLPERLSRRSKFGGDGGFHSRAQPAHGGRLGGVLQFCRLHGVSSSRWQPRWATGIIDPNIVNNRVIAATLVAACAWDILTWYWGLPTSSSHALIGGMIGAVPCSSSTKPARHVQDPAPVVWNWQDRTVHRIGTHHRHGHRAGRHGDCQLGLFAEPRRDRWIDSSAGVSCCPPRCTVLAMAATTRKRRWE